MNLELQGKTALITGSTAGVGYKIAEILATNGVNVVINGRRLDAVKSAVVTLSELFPDVGVQGVAADVGTAEGVLQVISQCPTADILVNNVGIYGFKDFLETTDDEWHRYFEVNVMSAVRLIREYLPQMVQRFWGRILLISSEWALNIPPDMIPYGMTKSSILSLTQGISKRIASTGVTINSILPGPVHVQSGVTTAQSPSNICLTMEETIAFTEEKHRRKSELTFYRIASPDEVAEIALQLCLKRNAGKNGTFIHVDGHL